MPREIFGEVSNPSVKLGSQAWYTVPLSILVHSVLVGLVIVVPLMATDVLPSIPGRVDIFLGDPELPDAPPPPAAPRTTPRTTEAATNPDAAPIDAPSQILPEREIDRTPKLPEVVGGIDLPGGPGGIGSGVNIGPPPPMPPPPAQTPAFVRPGGNIKQPAKVHHVPPVYPAIAQQARVEGTVIIEAMIGTDGRVKDARVLRSIVLLDQAALDAVTQWRFTPTLLNGVPVPVLMTVTVTFTLR